MLQSQLKAAVLMHQQQGLSQYDFACSSLGNCVWNIANILLIATGHDANSLYCNGPIVLLVIE